jgi:hypothetical protein
VNTFRPETIMNRKLACSAPLLLALTAAALVAPTGSSAANAACVPGRTNVAGKAAMRYCGPAKAKATVGTKSFAFSGGACTVSGPYFTVNIGVHLINKVANAKPGPSSYFGATITPSDDGVHLKQALLWTSGGKEYEVLADRITLNKGLKSGYFSGRANGQKVKGTFIC